MKDKIQKLNILLSSETKYLICFALSDERLSLKEIVIRIENFINRKINRETIYRALDSMIDSSLVEKEYSKLEKEIKYLMKIKKIEIDFLNKNIRLIA